MNDIRYFVRKDPRWDSDVDYEFYPDELLPYYDIFKNGDVIFYIEKNGHINEVNDYYICIEEIEEPVRVYCNE